MEDVHLNKWVVEFFVDGVDEPFYFRYDRDDCGTQDKHNGSVVFLSSLHDVVFAITSKYPNVTRVELGIVSRAIVNN